MLNISENRRARKWSRKELVGRLLWQAVAFLFRYSPRLCWGWRVLLLRLFGATIGKNVRIDPTARIFIPWNLVIDDWTSIGFDVLVYNLGKVTLGKQVTISQRSHLCAGTHDHRDPAMPLLKCTIEIQDGCWVCADAFIGPNVVVGEKSVVGARAVVTKSFGPSLIVVGNPCRVIGPREFHAG
ncbi:MAG: putative colanic acid biosynthesis acetyltransferase [Planctomycetes bacterium]|nr:putative colanic acid biosynthesis acetyltransferase [Planctomycetota bacterium]